MSSSRTIHKKEKEKIQKQRKITDFLLDYLFSPILFFFLMFITATIFIWFASTGIQRLQSLSVLLLFGSIITIIFFIFKDKYKQLKKKDKENDGSWGKGATGEEHVENLLRQLPENYLVINDFQTNEKGNVDHIVIAPAGVFLIETKHTSGYYSVGENSLLRNGKKMKKNYLKQVWAQSKYWRKAFKNFFNKGYSVPIYSHLVLLNTKWVDKKVFVLAEKWRMRISVGDYILKNLLQYGNKKRLNSEQQHQIYDFIQLMNKK